jgi:hypothetical protein
MSQSLARILVHIIFSTKNRKVPFKEELRASLKRYRVEYDERYVWD